MSDHRPHLVGPPQRHYYHMTEPDVPTEGTILLFSRATYIVLDVVPIRPNEKWP